jgi:pyruvate dehydrogenase E1 component
MVSEQEDVFYYLTIENENYHHPPMAEGAEQGILQGMHRVREADGEPAVRLLGSGAILRQTLEAADLLAESHDLQAEVWSVTSYTELRREALLADRQKRLRGDVSEETGMPWVTRCLGEPGEPAPPTVAASDYMKALPDGIRAWVPGHFEVLGTDGFGRSDYRAALRDFFEVDHRHIAVAALHSLSETGRLERSVVDAAIAEYEIDPDRRDPARL